MKKYAMCITAVVVLLLLTIAPSAARVKKNVLYLNSYHHGYRWSDNLLEGIRSVLDQSRYKIDLQIEYMDAKKYNYAYINSRLLTLYSEKFKQEDFDVIIVSDNDALNFVLEYRGQLFGDVPVVFCGINDLESIDISGGDITGVVESFNLLETIKTARTLHPEKKQDDRCR